MNVRTESKEVLTNLKSEINQGLDVLNLRFSDSQLTLLGNYLLALEKWNRTYNLTAIRNLTEMVSHHLWDSLAVFPHLPLANPGASLLDVGSGPGLPGIPLAISSPHAPVTVLDSNQKKVAFMRQVVGELQLGNVKVVGERVEAWHGEGLFQVIISRAYSELSQFIDQTKHLLAQNGIFAAMKGRYPMQEIENLQAEYRVCEVVKLAVPGLNAERHLVLVARK